MGREAKDAGTPGYGTRMGWRHGGGGRKERGSEEDKHPQGAPPPPPSKGIHGSHFLFTPGPYDLFDFPQRVPYSGSVEGGAGSIPAVSALAGAWCSGLAHLR